ncbi:MAG: hypothetical protein PHV51_06180 [Methanosarcinaceae archaeon]|nr:hypothetical protein [Methanosarcinaceae archaeon]
MDKKDAIYTVILAISLFSLSLLLFSQGITSLSVSIKDEKSFAVSVPSMFSMSHVLIMLFFTAIGSHSFTILGWGPFTSKEHINSGNNVEESFSSSYEDLPSQDPSEFLASPASQETSLASDEARSPAFEKSPLAGSMSSSSGPVSSVPGPSAPAFENPIDSHEAAESPMTESDLPVGQKPFSMSFDRAEHKKKVALEILQGDEKALFVIISEKEEILQSDLVLESGFSKVKVSRVLQKLERKFLVKRKPFGNTNKVMLAK